MRNKHQTALGDTQVVAHDLTRDEQSKRNDVWPTFRKLREHNIRCTLPRYNIMLKGKAMTDEEITQVLSRSACDGGLAADMAGPDTVNSCRVRALPN